MTEYDVIYRAWITVGPDHHRIYAKWYGHKAFRILIDHRKNDEII